jgi:glycosyltransferase involved in cell wall biosynthesis
MINKLVNKLGEFKYTIIPQSIQIDNQSEFSIRRKFNISSSDKIILFPAGIRKVKDPKFIINELLEILEANSDYYVILIGAIHDIQLYNDIFKMTKNQKRFIVNDAIEHNDFINVIKESQMIINSSISEGMSNILMEGMKLEVPIIARLNEGNKKLIKHLHNGLLFETPEEFKKMFKLISSNDHLRLELIENAHISINQDYSINAEIKGYKSVINNILHHYYFEYKDMKLLFLDKVHPYSVENNELFEHLSYTNQDINVLDVGCGAGIFTIIFLLMNNITLNELVLTDIEENCIISSYFNFLYNKEKFKINKITFIQSDILNSLGKEYFNKFDVVLANMPQTPSIKPIRSN